VEVSARDREAAVPPRRDATPALGAPGEPGAWSRARDDAEVALQRRGWGDAAWSFLFDRDTAYASAEPAPGQVAEAARRMRSGPAPEKLGGPFVKAPVWTWEVPLYFWFGGVAAGSSFVAAACDAAGDRRSAAIARRVALGAVAPCPPLLIADLGRPGRFLNMLRILKPRSPMSTGAWCLVAFGTVGAGAVGADLAGRPRTARRLGAANALLGAYLGSYAGVLLATTAVPVWARSRAFLGPIFVSTAAATGAAACRLALVAAGLPAGHPTRSALGTIETGAVATELALSRINARRLGRAGRPLHESRSGRLFRAAEAAAASGLALRLARRRLGPRAHHVASALYLAGGLAVRHAWIEAGRASARDDEAVALGARSPGQPRKLAARARRPRSARLASGYAEAVRRASLAVERALDDRPPASRAP
jgi:hypothetical protein